MHIDDPWGSPVDRPLSKPARLAVVVALALLGGCSGHISSPENGVVEQVMAMQLHDRQGALNGVCAAQRPAYRRVTSSFRSSMDDLDGFIGMADRGWPTDPVDQRRAIVYVAAGTAGPARRPWFNPRKHIYAVEMRLEEGDWRVCGVKLTDGWVDFDVRMSCERNEVSDPDDPNSCASLPIVHGAHETSASWIVE